MPIVKRLKMGRGPGSRVHAVSDRLDVIPREHQSRYFAVTLGDPVHIPAHVQSEIGHVEHGLGIRSCFASRLMVTKNPVRHIRADYIGEVFLKTQESAQRRQGKLVVTGRYGSMGRENALLADSSKIADDNLSSSGLGHLFLQQFQRKQAGVTFVHVEAIEAFIT